MLVCYDFIMPSSHIYCIKYTYNGVVMSVCLYAWFIFKNTRWISIKFGMDVYTKIVRRIDFLFILIHTTPSLNVALLWIFV